MTEVLLLNTSHNIDHSKYFIYRVFCCHTFTSESRVCWGHVPNILLFLLYTHMTSSCYIFYARLTSVDSNIVLTRVKCGNALTWFYEGYQLGCFYVWLIVYTPVFLNVRLARLASKLFVQHINATCLLTCFCKKRAVSVGRV